MINRPPISALVAISLLFIASPFQFLHLPNQLILVGAGILVMTFGSAPEFLFSLNRQNPNEKGWNALLAVVTALFIPVTFSALQIGAFPPLIISIVLGIFMLVLFGRLVKAGIIDLKKFNFLYAILVFLGLIVICTPLPMQVADYGFEPAISNPAYSENEGPIVLVDQGHNNFHTLDGRLYSTGNLLKRDGYRVSAINSGIGQHTLDECSILLIVNAVHPDNEDWTNPTYSAFSVLEIEAISNWVHKGGSLFLIADHMPFAGAANDLANAFGFEFENGYAKTKGQNLDLFTRKSQSLHDNPITNGNGSEERIDSIVTFTGSAIRIPENATAILTFDDSWATYNPDTAWKHPEATPISISGLSQGAYKEHGQGRVVVFGEAMMFTAQLGGGLSWVKLGMNSKTAPRNYQLFLNSIYWLDKGNTEE